MLLHDESPLAVESRDHAFVLGTYARTHFHPRDGKGARLFDAAGVGYWDLLGGIAVNVLGYQHPAIVRILREEAKGLLHVSNLFYHPTQGILAERLVSESGLSRAFFCNSGTEANEAALKFARLRNPGRPGIVALRESFHGRTLGALSLTGHDAYREPFQPLVPGVSFVEPNDCVALENAIGAETAAIIVEPIMGEGGIIPLTPRFLQTASALADRFGAVLICDEIQCGLGRTGSLFAFQQAGIVPDIVTLAKPLGGGLPLGAVLTGPRLEGVVKPGHHGTTFGGNPLACRLGIAVLDEIHDQRLLEKISALGTWLEGELTALHARCGAVVDVRGRGLMWGIEIDRPAGPIAGELLDRGFIVGTARENVIRLLPPYIVPKKALVELIDALDDILSNEKEIHQ